MPTLSELLSQRAVLDSQIIAIQSAERAVNKARLAQAMKEAGLSPSDFIAPSLRKSNGHRAPVKYRDVSGNTWSGRGLKPVWLREALAAGNAIESFRVV